MDACQLIWCDLTGSFGFTTLRHSYMVVSFEHNQHPSHENECHWKEIGKMYRQITAQKAIGEFYTFHALIIYNDSLSNSTPGTVVED